MATSSITKEFVVKDEAAFAKLKKSWTRTRLRQKSGRISISEKGERKISHLCISLSDLLERAEETHGSAHLYDALRSFQCCRDEDIEHFLQEKAVEFLRRNWCSVYLLVDEQAFDAGRIKIDAYFYAFSQNVDSCCCVKNDDQGCQRI